MNKRKALESSTILIILLALYEVLVVFKFLDPLLFPSIKTLVGHIINETLNPNKHLLLELQSSMTRLLFASIISVPLAIVLACFVMLNQTYYKYLRPLMYLVYPIPKLAIYPLLLFIFGIGSVPKVILISLSIFFPVFFSTRAGIEKLYTSGYVEVARFYQVNKSKIIVNVFIQGAYAEILEGLKLGLGAGLIMVIASESLMSQDGIGHLIWNGWDQFRILDVYTGIISISFVGVILFVIVDFFKYRLDFKYYGK